jgi:hypothetical protein
VEKAVIFNDHLEYFSVIWYNLRYLGLFCGPWVYFAVFWYIFPVLVRLEQENLATLITATVPKLTCTNLT